MPKQEGGSNGGLLSCHVKIHVVVYDNFPPQERNIVRYMFTHPVARALLPGWEEEAQGLLALFRASTERYVGEPWFKKLVADLQESSEEFRAWWPRHDIRAVHTGVKELKHPLVGQLVLRSNTFQATDAPDLRMVVYTPQEGTNSAQKLAQLADMKETQKVG